MADEEELPEGFEEQEWTYIGRIRLKNGDLGHSWLTPDEATMNMSGKGAPSHPVIGGVYLVKTNRAEGTAFLRSARWLRSLNDDALTNGWRADSRAEQTIHDQTRLELKLSKENGNIGNLTLAELREMMRRRKGYNLRTPLLAAIMEYVSS